MSKGRHICAASIALLAALGLATTASGGESAGGGPSASAAKLRKVTVGSNFYSPRRLTIKRGDRVRWTWRDTAGDRHDVNVRRGPERFRSRTQSSGTYTRKFRKAGTFKLYCTQHVMFMTLRVRR